MHWRHSLNDWVVAQLENEGYMSPSELASRAKLSKKKLGKCAVRIVDDWDKRGEIKSLYKSFKDTLSSARESTVCIFTLLRFFVLSISREWIVADLL